MKLDLSGSFVVKSIDILNPDDFSLVFDILENSIKLIHLYGFNRKFADEFHEFNIKFSTQFWIFTKEIFHGDC